MAKGKKRNKHAKPKQTDSSKKRSSRTLMEDDMPILMNNKLNAFQIMVRRDKIRGPNSIPPILVPDSIYTGRGNGYKNGPPPDTSLIDPNALATYPANKRKDYTAATPEIIRLTKEYMQAISASIPHISETQLCKFDLIDVEQFKYADGRNEDRDTDMTLPVNNPCGIPTMLEYNTEKNDNSMRPLPDIRDHIAQNKFWSFVPCFKEGVIKANKCRYFYYKVNEVDPEKETISMYLKTYYKYENVWVPSIHADIDVKWIEKDNDISVRNTEGELFDMMEWMTAVDTKTLGWTKTETVLWKGLTDQFAILTNKFRTDASRMAECSNRLAFMMPVALKFCAIIAAINQMMASQKPNVQSKSLNAIKINPLDDDHVYESIIRDRTVRQVGIIRIASDRTPVVPSERSAANYITPTWKQRGYVRTYKKTGKKVWINEMTKRRHILSPDTSKPTPGITVNVHPDTENPFTTKQKET